MPLQSRVNRTTRPATPPADDEGPQTSNLNVSPRRRQSVAVAGQNAALPPRTDTLEQQEQEEQGEHVPDPSVLEPAYVDDTTTEAHQEALDNPQVEEQRTQQQAPAAEAPRRTRKARTAKPKAELPDDFSQMLEAESPAELRANMKLVEDVVRDKRAAFEEELKIFRRLYRDLSDKLAETL